MSAAKAHPYLVSFGKLGLIEQDPQSGRYGLGPLAMQLGLISLQQYDPVRLATRLIGELDEVELEIAAAVKQLQPPSEPVEGRPSTIAEAFDPNFGYISKSAGNYADTTGDIDGPGGVPTGFVDLAARNFLRELPEALSAFGDLFGCLAQPPGAAFGRKRRQVASVDKEVCSVVLSDVLAPDKAGSDAQLR
jgi:hypothetical protein